MKNLVLLVAAVALVSLTGCAKKEQATPSKPLTIWINGDKPYEALAEIGKKFEAETGVKVNVEHPVGMESTFGQAAVAGNGPDIIIWAHDRLGEWAASGLLDPIDVSDEYKAKFDNKGWSAFTYQGKIWGYPLTMEAISLIYNKDLIAEKDLPKHLMDIKNLQLKEGVSPLLWAYDTPYFTWPFLAGEGGYIYKRDADGNYDINDIGVNTPGAIKALAAITTLIDDGTIPRGVTYDVMAAKMAQGECAMMISGPWAWTELEKAGINYGIATIPGVTDVVRPLVGIQGAMINSKSEQKDVAKLFIEDYLETDEALLAMSTQKFGGPVALKTAYDKQKSDEKVMKSMENVELGVLMPNIPQMGVFWANMEAAFKTATAGQATAADALNDAAKNMETENSK